MRTRTTSRLRRAAKTLALGAACARLVLTGFSPDASADPPAETALKNAYKDFVNAFKDLEELFRESDTYDIDEVHPVGAPTT
jgi:hypothetical protein